MMADFQSPLQILDFLVMKLDFEVSDHVEPNLSCEQTAGLDFDLRFRDEERSDCLLVLKHALNETDEDFERCGFRLNAEVAGVFNLEGLKERYPDEGRRNGVLLVNGLSVVYSMLRQVVAQIASQSPVRRLMLPTINMQDFLSAYAEAQTETETEEAERSTT